MTIGPGLQHFSTYLKRSDKGITAEIYLGTTIPGRFCPNLGFISNPTMTTGPAQTPIPCTLLLKSLYPCKYYCHHGNPWQWLSFHPIASHLQPPSDAA
jgi:hypothetical protein